MPILDNPLFGDEASGTVNTGIIYSNQWGWPIARAPRAPVFQRTPAQDETRSSFALAIAAWKILAEADKQAWRIRAPAPLTGFNLFLKAYLTGQTIVNFPARRALYGLTILGQLQYGRND